MSSIFSHCYVLYFQPLLCPLFSAIALFSIFSHCFVLYFQPLLCPLFSAIAMSSIFSHCFVLYFQPLLCPLFSAIALLISFIINLFVMTVFAEAFSSDYYAENASLRNAVS